MQSYLNTPDENCFVFSINSDFTAMDNSVMRNPVLVTMNPNYFCYFYCIKYSEFHSITVRGELHTFMSPRLIFLKSYYPFHDKHFLFLKQFLDNIRNQRLEIYERDMRGHNRNKISLETFDSQVALQLFTKECQNYIQEIQRVTVPNRFKNVCILDLKEIYIKYETPEMDLASIAENCLGIADILNLLSYEDFIFILFSMMKEKSIIFVSQQMNILTSVIMTFVSMLKPFRWPFPCIYS